MISVAVIAMPSLRILALVLVALLRLIHAMETGGRAREILEPARLAILEPARLAIPWYSNHDPAEMITKVVQRGGPQQPGTPTLSRDAARS